MVVVHERLHAYVGIYSQAHLQSWEGPGIFWLHIELFIAVIPRHRSCTSLPVRCMARRFKHCRHRHVNSSMRQCRALEYYQQMLS